MAKYSPVKMGKTDLVKGEKLFAGLNSLEPGQEHALHAHEGQEKMYFVLEGAGEVQGGDDRDAGGCRHGFRALVPPNRQFESVFFCVGSPTWIRTTVHGSKGRCPTVRRSGKIRSEN